MALLRLPFSKKKIIPPISSSPDTLNTLQAVATSPHPPAYPLSLPSPPPPTSEFALYESLRYALPIVDAAINKIIRLVGQFSISIPPPTDPSPTLLAQISSAQSTINSFVDSVPVGLSSFGLHSFINAYLDSLLTYGNAAAEILTDKKSNAITGIINSSIKNIVVSQGDSPISPVFLKRSGDNSLLPLPNQKAIIFTALNPPTGSPYGCSILRGLPALSKILLGIYRTIGLNFDRVGNVRYAVTYNPKDDLDKAFASDHASLIASEWASGMAAAANGEIRDFVAVGDVNIRVIGAENQILDTQIPVRQLLEQIVAKLAIPPFLLGLSWSSTERMSSQQVDILTSELEFFRKLLDIPIKRIISALLDSLSLSHISPLISLSWECINLQDEAELADSRLKSAQAALLEFQLHQQSQSAATNSLN